MAFNILEGMNYVQQQGDIGRAQGKENRLAQLSQQAYGQTGADRQSSLAQMEGTTAGAGHAAGAKFRQMDSDAAADLATDANRFLALAEMGDPAAIETAYAQFAQKAASVTGYPIPPTYDPKFLGGIRKLAGATQAELPTSVQEYQFAQKNPGYTDYRTQIAAAGQRPQHGTYNGTPGWITPDGFSPMPVAGAPAPQSAPQPQPGQRQYAPQEGDQTAMIEQEIGRQLSPQERAQIAGGTFNLSVPVGQQAPAPQQFAQQGGLDSGILSQAQPPITASEKVKAAWPFLNPQQRQQMIQQDAGLVQDPKPQMLTDAEVAQQGFPKGTKAYRDADGIVKTTYTPPAAAKADGPKELTGELKLKRSLFENARRSAGEWKALVTGPDGEFNDVAARMPKATALLRAAVGNKLRAESGAAISAQEIENETNRYLGGLFSSDGTNNKQAQMLLDDLDNQLGGLGGAGPSQPPANGGFRVLED